MTLQLGSTVIRYARVTSPSNTFLHQRTPHNNTPNGVVKRNLPQSSQTFYLTIGLGTLYYFAEGTSLRLCGVLCFGMGSIGYKRGGKDAPPYVYGGFYSSPDFVKECAEFGLTLFWLGIMLLVAAWTVYLWPKD